MVEAWIPELPFRFESSILHCGLYLDFFTRLTISFLSTKNAGERHPAMEKVSGYFQPR